MVLAGLTVVGALGGLALFITEWRRTHALRTAATGPLDVPASGEVYIDSHTSNEIPRAAGLVVAGATITDLKTGEMVEIPGSRGTCFAVDPRGYLLTNRHVVEEFVKLSRADAKIADLEKTRAWRVQPNLWVYFAKERYDAKVVYSSTAHDVAVLRVERRGPCFRLYESRHHSGHSHLCFGFPRRLVREPVRRRGHPEIIAEGERSRRERAR
jgi:S1-C subfamily serine protease